jgi:hypothetical protein
MDAQMLDSGAFQPEPRGHGRIICEIIFDNEERATTGMVGVVNIGIDNNLGWTWTHRRLSEFNWTN